MQPHITQTLQLFEAVHVNLSLLAGIATQSTLHEVTDNIFIYSPSSSDAILYCYLR